MDITQFRKHIYSSLNSPQTVLSRLVRNCILLARVPTEFLHTFGDPMDKVPHVKEVNEAAHNMGEQLTKELTDKASGGMRIYFVGSNFFRLPGISDDIDFLVEYATEDERKAWKNILTEYFGKPSLETRTLLKWECAYKGFQIEISMSNPHFRIFQKVYEGYHALLSDPELLAEYEQLKRDAVGVPTREYNRRQLYFFRYYAKHKAPQG